MTAKIFDISRCSLHDGPGVRTVVYFKGCTLRCLWCHNPEGLSALPQILYYPDKCISCGRCASLCPKCHAISDGIHSYNPSLCSACGQCAARCPSKSLTLCGTDKTVEELMEEIRKDKPYFTRSGGGVTASGGEALLYPDFLCELFSRCAGEGIHTALESALNVPRESLEKVLPVTGLLIADLKHSDSAIHAVLTGAGNGRILENLSYAASHHENIWIRIPLIPGYNDGWDNLKKSAEIIDGLGSAVKRVELLKYNNLYGSKYSSLGMIPPMPPAVPQTDEEMEEKQEFIRGLLTMQI
ncbi:MAG: glycyl-radical enzyme activating protein [Eubacteriales bacterium]